MSTQQVMGIPQQDVPIPERGTYVPSWCPWLGEKNADLNTQVTHDGKPLGFTVGQVLPERRWAVRLNGELVEQREFAEQIKRWYSPLMKENDDINAEPIPTVERFVSKTWAGPDRGYLPIGFDPDAPAPVEIRPIFDQQGEVSKNVDTEKIASVKILRELHEKGTIDAGTYQRESDRILGFSAQITSSDPPAPVQEKDTARCGKDVKAGYVKQHEGRCLECQKLKESEE